MAEDNWYLVRFPDGKMSVVDADDPEDVPGMYSNDSGRGAVDRDVTAEVRAMAERVSDQLNSAYMRGQLTTTELDGLCLDAIVDQLSLQILE
jgi:hypothetical protein